MIKLIIFDFDGVIDNNYELHWELSEKKFTNFTREEHKKQFDTLHMNPSPLQTPKSWDTALSAWRNPLPLTGSAASHHMGAIGFLLAIIIIIRFILAFFFISIFIFIAVFPFSLSLDLKLNGGKWTHFPVSEFNVSIVNKRWGC